MSLRIRLARGGAKKRPFYRIVVADSRSPRDGRFIDRLGIYHPLLPRDHAERVKLDVEKAKSWIAKGAQPTDRVLRFLDEAGVMKRPERHNPKKAEPGQKAKERAELRRQAEEEAKERAELRRQAEEEAKAAAEEAPAEPEAAESTEVAEPETTTEEAPAEATTEAEGAEEQPTS